MKRLFKNSGIVILLFGTIYLPSCKKEETSPTPPVVATTNVSDITQTTALIEATVTDDGGTETMIIGVCWNISPNPTISSYKTNYITGSGPFTCNISGLTPDTKYYVRAYATNSAGTTYGNEVTFTTSTASLASYPGAARYAAISFSIGTKLYLGLGSDFTDDESPQHSFIDFWEWDQATNVWTRKADFPGNSTYAAVCFSIGTKGYIGASNYLEINSYVKEFWEYDPATDTWTQKASIPSTGARYGGVGFSIGNKGYLGTGADNGDNHVKDFWEWDQATNVWIRKADFLGNVRFGAVGFSIGNKGYIGTGYGDGNTRLRDFWEWDQATNVWTRKADFGGNARAYAVGFSIGTKAYIGTGIGGSSVYAMKDLWEWDQATNVWTRKADFVGGIRFEAVGVSIGNKGYIGTGKIYDKNLNDFWEYDPSLN